MRAVRLCCIILLPAKPTASNGLTAGKGRYGEVLLWDPLITADAELLPEEKPRFFGKPQNDRILRSE